MATTSNDMSNLMRTARSGLDSYMYGGGGGEDTNEPNDSPKEDAAEMVVLGPDDQDDPSMYTYEPVGNGAWMVYPPGVPCETGAQRIEIDHPADSTEFSKMQARLDTAVGDGTSPPPQPASTGAAGTGGSDGLSS
jgi:hypothetical protein